MPPQGKRLIVEGHDDLHSVVSLMAAHVYWPNDEAQWPVYVECEGDGVDAILSKGYITAKLKSSDVQTLGVMLDADDQPSGRYQRFRDLVSPACPGLPPTMPEGGLVILSSLGKKVGLWVMPDNEKCGGLEDFLRKLVPNDLGAVWALSERAVDEARSAGAPCRACHCAKARLYTYLAWHDPPGQRPGIAITKQALDPKSGHADQFVSWFKNLYEL